MNGLRAAKRTTFAAYTLIWVLIGLVVTGPVAGFLSQRFMPQHMMGIAVDLDQIPPQLQSVFAGGSNVSEPHQIIVPVHDYWMFPASASLYLSLIAGGSVVYQTSVSSIELAPFQTGQLILTIQLPPDLLSRMQGQRIAVGGAMSLGAPAQLFSFTLNFPQS